MHRLTIRVVCFALAAVPLAATADDSVPSLARRVFDQNKDSIVKVTGVAQIRLSAAARPGLNLPERED